MLNIKSILIFVVAIAIGIGAIISCEGKDLTQDNDEMNSQSFVSEGSINPDNILIGVFKGKSFEFENVEALKMDWAEVVNYDPNLNVVYDEISIVVENDIYYLRGSGTNGESCATSKKRLTRIGDDLFEYQGVDGKEQGGGSTCTCTGCTSSNYGECEPNQDVVTHGWRCKPACQTGTCKKSVTANGN